jgi:lipopolysaccharide/colanic/teichoic acid biosynthesis glycosyltransferase
MPKGLSSFDRPLKRGFDIFASSLSLMITGWIIILAYIAASIDTKKGGFFTQERIGRGGLPFKVIKIRTMRNNPSINTTATPLNDPRITTLGSFLRKTKIDELPQLINVFLGQMSFEIGRAHV